MSKDYDCLINVVVIGNAGVGKTSLLLHFADRVFHVNCTTTIVADIRTRLVHIDARRIKMQIMDTAGQERYCGITSFYYRGAHGVLLAYDVTDENSFNSIIHWLQRVDLYGRENVCRILVGCKSDCGAQRTVQYRTAKAFADKHGLKLFETSSRDGTNVAEAFMAIAKEIMRCSPPPICPGPRGDVVRLSEQPPKKKKCCSKK